MQIDIYNSAKSLHKYLSVPAGTDLKTLQLPATIDPDFLNVVAFKKGTTIEAGQPLIGMNPDEIIAQIKQRGYALHSAKVEVRIGTEPK